MIKKEVKGVYNNESPVFAYKTNLGEIVRVEKVNLSRYVVHFKNGLERVNQSVIRQWECLGRWEALNGKEKLQ